MTGTLATETRGGLAVFLAVAFVVGFELRTAAGFLLGLDLPAIPYVAGLVGLLFVLGLIARPTG